MNEDDLIKGGRAAALPNGTEAGLVSYVAFHELRSSYFDLLAPGKRDAMTDEIFGRVPEEWEEEDDDDESDLAAADVCERIYGTGAAR